MVLPTWPTIWLLAGQDGCREQATDYIHPMAIGFLWMWLDALWIDQHPCNLSVVNGDLPGGFKPQPVYHLFRWYCYLFERSSQYLEGLDAMFWKLEQVGLKLKPCKYELFQWQITYLGHIISAQGIVTDKSKIEPIKYWPTPSNVTEIWSFMGFTGYYNRFILKCAQVAKPPHEVTSDKNAGKKKAAIVWDDRC